MYLSNQFQLLDYAKYLSEKPTLQQILATSSIRIEPSSFFIQDNCLETITDSPIHKHTEAEHSPGF